MSLFPDGRAVVMSKPPSFDLLTEIVSANTIRLATAFAHETGWNMLAPAISASKAKMFLLTGKSFFQTEPEVLRKWLKLAESGRVEAKLHFEKGITFHPKVLLVDGKRPFAIVGSGNLSRGGLHGNIECAVFVDSSAVLSELRGWFDTVYSSNATAAPLTEALILDYERKYKALRKPTNDLRKQQQLLEEELVTKAAAAMEHWDEAVSAAKQYLNSSEYQVTYRGRVVGVTRIKRALRYPAFDFDETGWKEFYSILELGHLIAIRRDGIFRHKARLQKGLRELVGAERNIPKVLDELLSQNGRLHIEGLGVNTISKILAVHDPRRWAVYNSPVADALKKFGYVPPRGASPAEKFIAFTKMMETFKTATGLKDAYALDAFMFDVYDKAKK
jgi:HKD family nuclease